MVDQEQVRKYWTDWVRRQIGGGELVQDAAVSAAVSAVLGGRDNEAAAEAARQVARSLGVKVSGDRAAGNVAVRPTPPPTSGEIAPAPAGAPPGDGEPLRCRLCGSVPAANMTI